MHGGVVCVNVRFRVCKNFEKWTLVCVCVCVGVCVCVCVFTHLSPEKGVCSKNDYVIYVCVCV